MAVLMGLTEDGWLKLACWGTRCDPKSGNNMRKIMGYVMFCDWLLLHTLVSLDPLQNTTCTMNIAFWDCFQIWVTRVTLS